MNAATFLVLTFGGLFVLAAEVWLIKKALGWFGVKI